MSRSYSGPRWLGSCTSPVRTEWSMHLRVRSVLGKKPEAHTSPFSQKPGRAEQRGKKKEAGIVPASFHSKIKAVVNKFFYSFVAKSGYACMPCSLISSPSTSSRSSTRIPVVFFKIKNTRKLKATQKAPMEAMPISCETI